MKGDGLGKLYDQLSFDELFRLRLAAMARGDRLDCDRLDRACPYGKYHEYRERLAASEVLTLCTLVDLSQKLAKLQMMDALRPIVELLEGAATDAAWLGYLDGRSDGWKAAGKRGSPPDVSDDTLTTATERAYGRGSRLSTMLEQASGELASMARAPRDALAAFAETELGVKLDVLLGAWAPGAVATLAEHVESLDAAAPDVEGVSLLGDVLRLAWRKHGLSDPDADMDDALRERYEAALARSDGLCDA